MSEKLTQEERQIIDQAHKRFSELPEDQRKGMSFQELEAFFGDVEAQIKGKSDAYEAHSDFVEHYKEVQKLSIERFKKKYPNGAAITDGEFLSLNNKGE